MKSYTISIIAPLVACLTLHATAGPESTENAATSGNGRPAAPQASLPEAGHAPAAAMRAIGRQAASDLARRVIERRTGQSARVTGITREDDHGARWEVEVTTASGREFDVYVNSAGRVVKIVRSGRDTSSSGLYRHKAAAIALAHVRESTGKQARVTGIEREDDYGARWEVEVTVNAGFEFDVYVDAEGRVVRVKAIGFEG